MFAMGAVCSKAVHLALLGFRLHREFESSGDSVNLKVLRINKWSEPR